MGKRRCKGKRRGNGKRTAVVYLGKHDKKDEAGTKVDKSPRTEQIDELSKKEDKEVGEEFEEVIEVVEEYEEELIEVDADEEIIEEIEEIVEVESEEPDEKEVEDGSKEHCEVEEQREDIEKKTNADEAPSEAELVEEQQSADVEEKPDNKEAKEEKYGDKPEEPDDEEVEDEMEDVEEETNEEIEESSEDEKVKEVVTVDRRASLNKQEDADGQSTERPGDKLHHELKWSAESSENVSKSSDSYITKQEPGHIHSFSSEKKVSADVSQIRQDSSKGEPCYGNPDIMLKSGDTEIVSAQEQGANISSCKKKHSRWDSQSESHPNACEVGGEVVKKRKSRWSCDENPVKMPDLLQIPHFFSDNNKTMQDPEIQQLVDELKNINQEFLRVTGMKDTTNNELAITNSITEASLRAKFVKQKQQIFSLLLNKGFDFKSLLDGMIIKGGKYVKKIYVPVKEYPEYNFVGLFFGPRGNNHKRMEMKSGATIKLRGKGSIREDRAVKNTPDPSRDEDLHVLIEADNKESLNFAAKMVEKLLIPVAETENELKRAQMRELAALKGKIAPDDLCEVCGDAGHYSQRCPLIAGMPGANGHPVKGLSEVGAGWSSTSKIDSANVFSGGQLLMDKLTNKKIDDRKLFVGQLPFSVDDNRLMELFCQYGDVREAKVVKDADTGLSQGYAFVKYRHPADAAKAVKHMHGFRLEGRTLTVEISGLPKKTPTGTDPEKTTRYQQASQPSPILTNQPVASSFPGYIAPLQHYISSLTPNVSVLRPVTSLYLASTVSSPASTYSSPVDLAKFAGNPDQLPSPFSLQLGRSSSSLFSSGVASAPGNLAASGYHVYPSHTASIVSTSIVRPPVAANRLPPLGRPLAAPAAESLNFPGNPDSFRSRFL